MEESGYHGVDFDATLAFYEGWVPGTLGDPVPAMIQRVKDWLAAGEQVRIITARAQIPAPYVAGEQPDSPPELDMGAVLAIRRWCVEHIGVALPVQFWKDYNMIDLWDDRAVQVVPNTGEPVGPPRAEEPPAPSRMTLGQIVTQLLDDAETARPEIDPDVERAVMLNGGYLAGQENRIKPRDSITAKLISGTKSPADIKDVLRYAAVFPTATYADDVRSTVRDLEDKGYGQVRVRNYWDPNATGLPNRYPAGTYAGINIVFDSEGYRFEVQFHTAESWDANRQNRLLYEALSDGWADPGIAIPAMRRTIAAVPVPDGTLHG